MRDHKWPYQSESEGASTAGEATVTSAPYVALLDEEERTDVFEVSGPSFGAVTAGEHDLVLTVVAGPQLGLSCRVSKPEIIVGRGRSCDLPLPDPGLSRRHCRIIKEGDAVFLEDLGSRNGTFMNGVLVQGRAPLREGGRMYLGRHTLVSLSRQGELEQRAVRQLYESSMLDALTGLHNRRFFDQRLREEFAYATRHQAPLSVLLVDIDLFKQVNDTWGHPVGDQVLRHVAELVQGSIRKEDVAARFGGEEFAVLLRTENHEGSCAVAERMRARIEQTPCLITGHPVPVTVSVGVATAAPPQMEESAAALLGAADEALYRAKSAGRNRCEG